MANGHKSFGLHTAAAILVCFLGASHAGAQSFTFEDWEDTGAFPSIVVTDAGLTLTITAEGGGVVVMQGAFNPPPLETRAVLGSATEVLRIGDFRPLRFSFSQPVTAITLAFGDTGGDDDSPVMIQAFDAFDNLLGTLTTDYPENFEDGKMLAGSFPTGARYFLASSGSVSGNWHSIPYDIPSVSFVPEPGAVGVLLTLVLAALRRRSFVRRGRIPTVCCSPSVSGRSADPR